MPTCSYTLRGIKASRARRWKPRGGGGGLSSLSARLSFSNFHIPFLPPSRAAGSGGHLASGCFPRQTTGRDLRARGLSCHVSLHSEMWRATVHVVGSLTNPLIIPANCDFVSRDDDDVFHLRARGRDSARKKD